MDKVIASIGHLLNATYSIAPPLASAVVWRLFRRPRARAKLRSAELTAHGRATVERLDFNDSHVVTYRWGNGERPVLLLHGWESRGSRFAGLVEQLADRGYTPITFDAPGHGDSPGTGTTILEYRAIIEQLHQQYGTFEAIVAHSFGVLCAFHAVRGGVRTTRMVAISGVSEFDYLPDEFARRLGLRTGLHLRLRDRMEAFLAPEADVWQRLSVPYQAKSLNVPVLVIHDENDDTVDVSHAHRIAAAYGDAAQLVVTRGLGHRRILGEPAVMEPALAFIEGDIALTMESAARHTG